MFIVLEGNDGSGKSSLVQTLADEFRRLPMVTPGKVKVNVQHIGPPKSIRPDQSVQDYADQERDRLMAMITCYDAEDPDLLYVYDRFHSGSAAYGPLYRPGANLDEEFGQLGREYFEEIERALADRGALTIYLTPSVSTLLKRTDAGNGRDEFLDKDLHEVDEYRTAQRRVVAAQNAMPRAQANGDPSAVAAVERQIALAQLEVAQIYEALVGIRRGQLLAISDRYDRLITEHRDVLHSYIGHPLYLETRTDEWPDIAFSQNRLHVAYHVLEKALEASERAFTELRSGARTLPPLTPVVDSDGQPVLISIEHPDTEQN